LRLLGISGALRKASTNTLLLHEAARAFGECDFRLASIGMPVFDEDDEIATGMPPETIAFADDIDWADAVVISTPEYNKSIPGGLKNAFDWLSRTGRSPLKDKLVAIASASDGRFGAVRGQFELRHCLVAFQPRLLQGPEMTVTMSREAFDETGHLRDPRNTRTLTSLMTRLRAEAELLQGR
jgi:chromate reductase, NAD(P)H dehydrogenase (quinone)